MDQSVIRILSLSLVVTLVCSGCFDSADSDAAVEDAEETRYREEKADRDAVRKQVSELKAEKKELEGKLDKISDSVKKQDSIRAEEVKIATELEAVRNYAANLELLEQGLDSALGIWRDATRTSFKGVKLSEIVTVSGAKFSDVTIVGVSDDTLAITHSGGDATVPILDLPVGLRKNVIHEATVLSEVGL